ncbi:hypothetical protein M0812_11738 [Anaeramoeba flamelloides]|uniref:Uncharacterized protein n=1 Tax=Anaeramoeba flamelloides TaxID=1746091 RepID=A0AAV7ZXP0_9EUKA|nr:hypothetical protein M0812_11738 [Anaeramoeba flamelloides]
MDVSTNQIDLLEADKNILEKLKHTHSIKSRLILWLQLYPRSIIGLTIEHLNKSIGSPKTKSALGNQKKKNKYQQPAQRQPKEIKILRKSLNKLSEYTGVSRRSLERGLSSFFSRQYSLINIEPYSREWLIFGNSGGANKTQNQKNRKYQKKKQKHRKKPKEKHLRFRSKKTQVFSNSQKNTQAVKSQINNNTPKTKANQTLNSLDNFHFSHFDESRNPKHQFLNYHQQTQNHIQSNVQSQTTQKEQVLPDKTTYKPSEEMLLIEFQNQNRYKSFERKTPLEILCEVSQLYKKRHILTTNPLKPNRNLHTNKTTNEQQNKNSTCFISHDWRSKN